MLPMALEDVSQVRSLKINGVNIQLALFLRLNPKHMQVFQSQISFRKRNYLELSS